MKRTRVNDINGDCKANSCLISPVCTIWKTNTASKVLIAAVGSLSLERWRGQAPQTELQGFEGQLESADPFQKRKGVHLTWDSWCADWKPWTFNQKLFPHSTQSLVWRGISCSGDTAKTFSPTGCREKESEWKKCVDGLCAVEFQFTASVYGSLYSAASSAVSITVLEHRGNKKLELRLRTRELFVITQQNKCILINSNLGCSWTAEGRYKEQD